jgi:hypothetical protein
MSWCPEKLKIPGNWHKFESHSNYLGIHTHFSFMKLSTHVQRSKPATRKHGMGWIPAAILWMFTFTSPTQQVEAKNIIGQFCLQELPLITHRMPKAHAMEMYAFPGGKVNILGGHSIGHSKQKSVYVHMPCSERFPRSIMCSSSSSHVSTFFCTLYSSSNSINNTPTGLSLEILVAS